MANMRSIPSIILLICFNVAFGQVSTFQKILSGDSIPVFPYTLADVGYSIENTNDNGYIIGGYYGSLQGRIGLVIKLDQNGDTVWTSILRDGTTNQTCFHATTETSDNGYISTGETQFLNWPYYDIILTKMDYNGNLLWTKVLGGPSHNDMGLDVLETDDGGFVIAGYTRAYGAGGKDAYIIKTNYYGDTIWTKVIGGTGNEMAQSISLTEDKGYIVTGYTSSYGAGGDDGLMFKLDSSGNLLWAKTYGNAGEEYIASSVILQNDTIVFVGKSESDLFLTKTTPDGDTIWTKHIGTLGGEEAYKITTTYDNGFAIAGYTLGGPPGVPNMYLVKTDYKGDTLWTKAYGENGGDAAYSMIETPDNGFALIGYTSILQGEYSDLYIVKTDAMGYSGCHEHSTASYTTNISTQITNPSLQITTGSEIESPLFFKTTGIWNTTECFTVGITQKSATGSYKLYPNPADQYVTFDFDNLGQGKYFMTFYDAQGRIVKTITTISTEILTIDIGGLTNGLYFFQLQSDGQIYLTGKIIKK